MKIKVGKVEVTDLIRAAALQDPLREDPEIRAWLDAPLEQEEIQDCFPARKLTYEQRVALLVAPAILADSLKVGENTGSIEDVSVITQES